MHSQVDAIKSILEIASWKIGQFPTIYFNALFFSFFFLLCTGKQHNIQKKAIFQLVAKDFCTSIHAKVYFIVEQLVTLHKDMSSVSLSLS